MTEAKDWQGYLVQSQGDCHFIHSSWKLKDKCVFGYDSDYTTMAISLLRLLSIENPNLALSTYDERINLEVVKAATGFEINPSGYHLKCNNDASLQIYQDDPATFSLSLENMQNIDREMYEKLILAWQTESNILNTSQGAYVSGQQYDETLESRLSLVAQNHEGLIWPQRQMDSEGEIITESFIKIEPYGEVISWTKLSAAGAPSEFAIRAPILGGISTVMVETHDGPNGVFLLVDDVPIVPKIGDSVEIVVRMLYAQEGVVRYGAKAIITNHS